MNSITTSERWLISCLDLSKKLSRANLEAIDGRSEKIVYGYMTKEKPETNQHQEMSMTTFKRFNLDDLTAQMVEGDYVTFMFMPDRKKPYNVKRYYFVSY